MQQHKENKASAALNKDRYGNVEKEKPVSTSAAPNNNNPSAVDETTSVRGAASLASLNRSTSNVGSEGAQPKQVSPTTPQPERQKSSSSRALVLPQKQYVGTGQAFNAPLLEAQLTWKSGGGTIDALDLNSIEGVFVNMMSSSTDIADHEDTVGQVQVGGASGSGSKPGGAADAGDSGVYTSNNMAIGLNIVTKMRKYEELFLKQQADYASENSISWEFRVPKMSVSWVHDMKEALALRVKGIEVMYE